MDINNLRSVNIRFYLLTKDIREGELAVEIIAKRLDRLVLLQSKNIEEYWKISEYMEISTEFRFTEEFDLGRKFEQIVDLLGDGWIFGNDWMLAEHKEAIWNLTDNNKFCIPKTQWAIVQLFPPDRNC
jgi:hypothetical protein